MATKRKIFFFIPFAIVICYLLYSWIIIFLEDISPHFTNDLGVILFVPVVYFLFKDKTFVKPLLTLGIYLLLAACKLANILPYTNLYKVRLGIFGLKIPFPDMIGTAFLILLLYSVLNYGNLIEIYPDYEEAKGKL
ncbi:MULTISPECIES: hypothetical protein [Niastella]|uniref:Uncharacterized protein n=1 Tax=Niastella soli TaxID=2821487 RepID=A0ABS3YSP0_9BACT|nr:hypothetical protein [Niastella soli]MBO9200931.1 hypothetical protein [Niastella soli]